MQNNDPTKEGDQVIAHTKKNVTDKKARNQYVTEPCGQPPPNEFQFTYLFLFPSHNITSEIYKLVHFPFIYMLISPNPVPIAARKIPKPVRATPNGVALPTFLAQ